MPRKTPQLHAVREAFLEADRPLGPQEVLDAARSRSEGLGLATVYRHVRALVEGGWLVPVEIPGQPPRYEVAGKRHHHHFHCRACGRVYDIEGCPGRMGALAPPGFRTDDHELTLYGRCAECAA